MIAQMEETRDRYGKTLVELAKADKNVVAMDCDLGRSTRSYRITEVDKDRFIEMGIAEQNMISTAAGMARMGKKVFANSFAVFLTGRAYDQIRQQLALPKLNVVLCGSSAGLTEGPDGATHQSVLDMALMRLLPNMVVFSPADGDQTADVVRAAYKSELPVYIRLSRYPTGRNIPEGTEFKVGKGQILREGKDIVLCGTGPVMNEVNAAAVSLREHSIEAGVVNFHTLKPFDSELVDMLTEKYRIIVSVEEHSIYGGLGTAIAEAMSENGKGHICRLVRHGVKDTFGESGSAKELLLRFGLDGGGIAQIVQKSVMHMENKV